MAVERGAIYRNIEDGGLVEIQETVKPHDQFDAQNASIPMEDMESETWFSIFYDIFRSDYRKIADSKDDLDEGDRPETPA